MTRELDPDRRALVLGGGTAALAAMAGLSTPTLAQPSPGPQDARRVSATSEPRPFRLSVPDSDLAGIKASLQAARLASPMLDDGWATGMSMAWLKDLRDYWIDGFDWRATEARLNRHPQYLADVGGTTLHYYHVPGKGPNPRPVLLGHGWPYSIYAFADVIDRLTDPARFGGNPADALTVVAPSMPGYGYSPATNPPLGPVGTMRLHRTLMRDVLGYSRFGVQGGDIGCLVGVYMARDFGAELTGLHLNIAPVPDPPPNAAVSAEEKAWRDAGAAYFMAEFDYLRTQANKPMMIGAALQTSPLATAAWIAEKFWSWSDHGGNLDAVISKDKLLTEVMAYVAPGTIASSFGMYRMIRDEIAFRFHPGGRLAVPTGLYLGPKEYVFANPSRALADRAYNLQRFTGPARGGHFPFLEQPAAFADDVLAFFHDVHAA
jgi:pimeloyl-ACP methyl ester carboxylesterase